MNACEACVAAAGGVEVDLAAVLGGCFVEVREQEVADAAGFEGAGGLEGFEFEVDLTGGWG